MANKAELLGLDEEISDHVKQAIWNGDVEAAFRYYVLMGLIDIPKTIQFLHAMQELTTDCKDSGFLEADFDKLEEIVQLALIKRAI